MVNGAGDSHLRIHNSLFTIYHLPFAHLPFPIPHPFLRGNFMANAAVAPDYSPGLWQRIWTSKNRNYFFAFLFVLPALINFTIFRYLPILAALRASFWQYSLLGGYGNFNGVTHYINMWNDALFWKAMGVTILFALLKVPLQVILSLVLAVFLAGEDRITGLVRGAVFIPVVTSVVVVSILWSMMYHSQLGLINSFLSLFGIPPQTFLSDPNRALPSVTAMMIWKEVGFSMIILMAGLKGIPTIYRRRPLWTAPRRCRSFPHYAAAAQARDYVCGGHADHLLLPGLCADLHHDARRSARFDQGDCLLYLPIWIPLSRHGLCQRHVDCDAGAAADYQRCANARLPLGCGVLGEEMI
ncbi:MAG: sugar ABC transporter permease [Caldilineaceae bacterium]